MMLTKPRNPEEFLQYGRIERVLLKLRDRRLYRQMKYELQTFKMVQSIGGYVPPTLGSGAAPANKLSFKHSGNAGDVIYSLPTIRAITGGRAARLALALDVPMRDRNMKHPLGGVQLNRKMFDMLKPLLEAQPYLDEVVVWEGEEIQYDLDAFRDAPLLLDRLGICRWYFYMFGIATDLSEPWLFVGGDASYRESIVVARSERYRNHAISYRFLRQYNDIVFLGVEDEYIDFAKQVPSARWVQVNDFLQMARVIAGSRLFIGNQSFPYSLAEGLKVPRVVELSPLTPNVVPVGREGYDVLFQAQFEHVVKNFLARSVV
ncbi:MAG: hypothetical protein QM790_00590 [Nibricoccus sp.]